jgi:hypothetical protein
MVYFICIVIYIYIVYIFRLNYKTIINIYICLCLEGSSTLLIHIIECTNTSILIYLTLLYTVNLYIKKVLPHYIYMLNIINDYNVYTYIYIYVKIIFGK